MKDKMAQDPFDLWLLDRPVDERTAAANAHTAKMKAYLDVMGGSHIDTARHTFIEAFMGLGDEKLEQAAVTQLLLDLLGVAVQGSDLEDAIMKANFEFETSFAPEPKCPSTPGKGKSRQHC